MRGRVLGELHRNLELEGGAASGDALQANGAAHALHQALADGESQTGAAEAARHAAVALGEGLEHRRLLLQWDADAGVAHREAQPQAIFLPVGGAAQLDLAALGELERVGQQVDQDLAQPRRIAEHASRHLAVGVEEQRYRPLARLHGHRAHRLGDQFARFQWDAFDVELAGFDARMVEHVVEHAEQRAGGVVQHREIAALLGAQAGAQQQLRHAEHTVQRRAHLMAHVGEELALSLAGGFGRGCRIPRATQAVVVGQHLLRADLQAARAQAQVALVLLVGIVDQHHEVAQAVGQPRRHAVLAQLVEQGGQRLVIAGAQRTAELAQQQARRGSAQGQTSCRQVIVMVWLCSRQRWSGTNGLISPFE